MSIRTTCYESLLNSKIDYFLNPLLLTKLNFIIVTRSETSRRFLGHKSHDHTHLRNDHNEGNSTWKQTV